MTDRSESEASIRIRRVRPKSSQEIDDRVAVEEPMEIRVAFGSEDTRSARSLSVTMRTPGNDFELAAGFLFTEGILDRATQIRRIEFCGPIAPGRSTSNIVKVDLAPDVELDLERLKRNFYMTSSCGICGKASLDALHVQGIQPTDPDRLRVRASVIHELPQRLRADQPLFESTGGLHAAALVDRRGELVALREDVGRHNALDKLLGRRLLDGEVPLDDHLMLVSGRASFEILQKALVAGVPMIVAVGAPSRLAIQMAERFGMTLVGFAGPTSFNIYSAPHRIMSA